MEASFELSLQTSFLMCSSAHCMVHLLCNNIPVNQSQVFLALSVFSFSDNSLIYAILRVFVLHSHYDDSISSKKLNVHHAFESMSRLGALIFLLKQHIS